MTRVLDLRDTVAQYQEIPVWQFARAVEEDMRKLQVSLTSRDSKEFEHIRLEFALLGRKYLASQKELDILLDKLYSLSCQETETGKFYWVRLV